MNTLILFSLSPFGHHVSFLAHAIDAFSELDNYEIHVLSTNDSFKRLPEKFKSQEYLNASRIKLIDLSNDKSYIICNNLDSKLIHHRLKLVLLELRMLQSYVASCAGRAIKLIYMSGDMLIPFNMLVRGDFSYSMLMMRPPAPFRYYHGSKTLIYFYRLTILYLLRLDSRFKSIVTLNTTRISRLIRNISYPLVIADDPLSFLPDFSLCNVTSDLAFLENDVLPNSIYLIFGMINETKNIDIIFNAFARANLSSAMLIIAGDISSTFKSNFSSIVSEFRDKINIRVVPRFLSESEISYVFSKSNYCIVLNKNEDISSGVLQMAARSDLIDVITSFKLSEVNMLLNNPNVFTINSVDVDLLVSCIIYLDARAKHLVVNSKPEQKYSQSSIQNFKSALFKSIS